jgi:hypothetical protein
MSDKPAYTAAYTGDGIEAYEPLGVGGGAQSPPTTPRVALEAEVKRLEAELIIWRYRWEKDRKFWRDFYAPKRSVIPLDAIPLQAGSGGLNDMAVPPGFPSRALRGGDGRPR